MFLMFLTPYGPRPSAGFGNCGFKIAANFHRVHEFSSAFDVAKSPNWQNWIANHTLKDYIHILYIVKFCYIPIYTLFLAIHKYKQFNRPGNSLIDGLLLGISWQIYGDHLSCSTNILPIANTTDQLPEKREWFNLTISYQDGKAINVITLFNSLRPSEAYMLQ